MSDTVFIGSGNLLLNVLENEGITHVSFVESVLGKSNNL